MVASITRVQSPSLHATTYNLNIIRHWFGDHFIFYLHATANLFRENDSLVHAVGEAGWTQEPV
jgi:hypothetical protein